jgi:hypothetical protein
VRAVCPAHQRGEWTASYRLVECWTSTVTPHRPHLPLHQRSWPAATTAASSKPRIFSTAVTTYRHRKRYSLSSLPHAPVLSNQVQTPTVLMCSLALPPPSSDAPQLSRTLSLRTPEDLLRPSRPPSPETPAFDIIDAYDYTCNKSSSGSTLPDPISPIYVPPPFTSTNVLKNQSLRTRRMRVPIGSLAYGGDYSATFAPTTPSEGGPLRGSHDVELQTPQDGPSPLFHLLKAFQDLHKSRHNGRTPSLPEIVLAPPVFKAQKQCQIDYTLSPNAAPSPLTPAFSIATPTVPPVPPRLGPLIVGGANASHRRYTPLQYPQGDGYRQGMNFRQSPTSGWRGHRGRRISRSFCLEWAKTGWGS